MDYTTNYQLPIWAETDRILRTDFNEAFDTIDEALETLACAALQIATGAYVGDGSESHAVAVPFPPKAVFLCTQSGRT